MNDWEVRVISESKYMNDRIKWLELGLKMVIKHSLDKEVRQMAQSYLDGEPTTADEHNCMIQYHDPGDENRQ